MSRVIEYPAFPEPTPERLEEMAREEARVAGLLPGRVQPARLDLAAICAELQRRLPEVDTVARCQVTELRGVRLLLVATEKSVAAGRQFALSDQGIAGWPTDTAGVVEQLLAQFHETVARAEAGETWWTREPLPQRTPADIERLQAAQEKRERRARRRLQ